MSQALRVGGMVPLTTLDYPGFLSCVLFCQGCAWRCRYCHNPDLLPVRGGQELSWDKVLTFLQQRQGMLEAVVFSGGEPTLQGALREAMLTVRAMGFRVGMHSAGIRPAAFLRALPLVDWVGFDIKSLPEDCDRITGVAGSGEANWQSLTYLLQHGVDYECRTTVHWQLLDAGRLLRLAECLRDRGVTNFAVQIVRTTRMHDTSLPENVSPATAESLWTYLHTLFPRFSLRGY